MTTTSLQSVTVAFQQLHLERASVFERPAVKRAADLAKPFQHDKVVFLREITDVLWKGRPGTPADGAEALDFCRAALMPHDPAVARLVITHLSYETACKAEGAARKAAFTDTQQFALAVPLTDIPAPYFPLFDHLMCHTSEELQSMQIAETHFLRMVEHEAAPTPYTKVFQLLTDIAPLREARGQLTVLSYLVPSFALIEEKMHLERDPRNYYRLCNLVDLCHSLQLVDEAQSYCSSAIKVLDENNRHITARQLAVLDKSINADVTAAIQSLQDIRHDREDLALQSYEIRGIVKGKKRVDSLFHCWAKDALILGGDIANFFRNAPAHLDAQVTKAIDLFLQGLTSRQEIYRALIEINGALQEAPTKLAHGTQAKLYRKLAPLEAIECCTKFCLAAAAFHESQGQQISS